MEIIFLNKYIKYSYDSPVKQSKKTATLGGHISRWVKISPIEKRPIKIQQSETQSSHYFHETLPRYLISTNEKNHIKSHGETFYDLCHLYNVPGCPSAAGLEEDLALLRCACELWSVLSAPSCFLLLASTHKGRL